MRCWHPLPVRGSRPLLGFTEIDRGSRLYNSAAVFPRGSVAGAYHKLYPAINKSVYVSEGDERQIAAAADAGGGERHRQADDREDRHLISFPFGAVFLTIGIPALAFSGPGLQFP